MPQSCEQPVVMVSTGAARRTTSQVYPLFLQDHIYGFRLFAGAKNFMAFPSATMAGVAAFVVGVGVHRRSQRAAAAVILISLALALLVTGSHWRTSSAGHTSV
jgi:hypothetical protein